MRRPCSANMRTNHNTAHRAPMAQPSRLQAKSRWRGVAGRDSDAPAVLGRKPHARRSAGRELDARSTFGRDSDTAGILGRHLDTRRPLNVQMSPENPRYVRMSPGDARRVRMSPDNAKRRDSAGAAGHPRQRARPPRFPYPVKPGGRHSAHESAINGTVLRQHNGP